MSDKPRPQQSAAKPAAQAAAGGAVSSSQVVPSSGDEDSEESLAFLAPAQGRDELGRLAHYRILKVLGRGGMGTVFMAEDPRLHRLIALKVMLPSIAKTKTACERFKREAQATAAIEHDHIVTIYEVNEDRGVPYLAMQILKGMTLDDWLKAGKTLNVPQIMRIGKEIAKGLAAAHARKLMHRDIKPSNIWLDATNKGRVKILDFGLARPTNEDTQLTQEGMILGTPAYMSPEQARGQHIDERSDLFSLGCVLYRLCAGRLPFSGTDPMSMLLSIINEEPHDVEALNSEVPGALAELIHRLLAKNPQDRPESARAVVQTLQSIERAWISNAKTLASPPVASSSTMPSSAEKHAPVRAEEHDPALEESAITALELLPQLPSSDRPTRSNYGWILAGLGGAILTVVSVLCCLGVMFATDHAQVRIVADDEAAQKYLQERGVILRDHHQKEYVIKGSSALYIPSGGYEVDTTHFPRGMQIDPAQFSLPRGATRDLTLSHAVPQPPPALKSERPPMQRVTTENAKKLQEAWARYLGRNIVETNLLGMKHVLIPAGEFLMGSSEPFLRQHLEEMRKIETKPRMERYLTNLRAEVPLHPVRITRPFYLGMFEVTVGQFSQFVAGEHYRTEVEQSKLGGTGMTDTREVLRRTDFSWNNTGYPQFKEHPVSNVTWADAEAFCVWLGKKEKKTCRLPTEAEWEFACRAGSTTLWHFGDDAKNAREYMWHSLLQEINFGKGAHPVGRKKANDLGLFDMHGNVEEMCSDSWSPTYYEKSPRDDPHGPMLHPKNDRVARGGSFLEFPHLGRSSYRSAQAAALGYVHVGFRVMIEVAMPE